MPAVIRIGDKFLKYSFMDIKTPRVPLADKLQQAKVFKSRQEAIPTATAIDLRRTVLDNSRWLNKEVPITIEEMEVQ